MRLLRALASLAVLVGLQLLLGCGGGGGAPAAPPTVDVTGSWAGYWASDDGISGGGLSFDLVQTGAAVQGAASLVDSDCYSSGSVSATVSGAVVTGTVTFGGFVVGFHVTVAGNTAAGRYNDHSGSACDGDAGVLQADRL